MWVLNDNDKTLKTIDLLDDIWMKRLSHKRLKTKFKEMRLEETEDNNDDDEDSETLMKSATNKTGSNATYMKDTDSNDSNSIASDNLYDGNNNNNNTSNRNNNNNTNSNTDETKNDDTEEKKSDELLEINENETDSNHLEALGSSNHLLTESQHDLLHAHATKTMPESVAVAAIESWTWLIASIGSDAAIGSLLDVYHLDFLDILEHNHDIDLRCAVGGALTLLLSNYKSAQLLHETNGHGKHSNGKGKNVVDTDAILTIFYEFLDESNIKRKNLLKEQKKKFRLYLKSLEHGWMPSIKIKLRQQVFEIEGWCKWIAYQRLAAHLLSGFQPHLLENATVQGAFDMENVEQPQPLTQV